MNTHTNSRCNTINSLHILSFSFCLFVCCFFSCTCNRLKSKTNQTQPNMSLSSSSASSSSSSAPVEAVASDALFFDVQQKTDKQHILDNPDTYIGSVDKIDADVWVLNSAKDGIEARTISHVPGLFKLFDEGIVNCRDHVVRMEQLLLAKVENAVPVRRIEVDIDPSDGTVTMTNDGNGIDVVQKEGVWVPELVFGHLRTSTNYNKDEKKIVGGKNGFGFKLVLVWSTYGRVETVDHIRGLKYVQEFGPNLESIGTPSITKSKVKPYTKITFRPDYARLGLMPERLSTDMMALLERRIYDIAAITEKNITVKYNGATVPIKSFPQYINLFIGDKQQAARVYEESSPRWEFAVALSPTNEFQQVSFVNGIHTAKGGKHVDYIMSQIVQKVGKLIEKKKKIKVDANTIRGQLMLFLRCDVENPSFDSQTKDFLTTPSKQFGSTCVVSDSFIEKVAKMGVADSACALTELRENRKAKRETDGVKTRTVRGIPKLRDANLAGTHQSHLCTCMLVEGDSAMAAVMSGLSSQDRDYYGIYPMKGKILNVRDKSVKKMSDNAEIADIKRILGLESGRAYRTVEEVRASLRYGRVMFFTDQDLDGSHIRGLGINLFASAWPTLAQLPGFICFMNTPILKARNGNHVLPFYNIGEYEQWKEQGGDHHGHWTVKYYKGLGTSTREEFRDYFRNKKIVEFFATEQSEDAIDLVFNKERANDRKRWLENYDRTRYLNTSAPRVSYEDFVHHEMIHFSKYDCARSIPNMMDGLKISQRKILFGAFRKNLTRELKVAQFAAYVSEHSCYHHGEASLNAAIVNMAQDFVGANNINLLLPNGQFGTRLSGGKDSASERYIFTQLNPLTRTLFPKPDDAVLTYLDDDGKRVEPLFYAPVIPMVLVNGAEGIGTGFSTNILCYNPLALIDVLRDRLLPEADDTVFDEPTFLPFYDGFTGTITPLSENKFLVRGKYEVLDENTVRVTELPVGVWTETLKQVTEELMDPGVDKAGKRIAPIVADTKESNTDFTVQYDIIFHPGKLQEWMAEPAEHGCNKLEKMLKLYKTLTSTNMHLFDEEEHLRKFDTVADVLRAFYPVRLRLYEARKTEMLRVLGQQLTLVSNKVRYIQRVLDGTIDLRRKTKAEIDILLASHGLDRIGGTNDTNGANEEEDSSSSPSSSTTIVEGTYQYLTRMPMDAVTVENVTSLLAEEKDLDHRMVVLRNTCAEQLWLNDLDEVRAKYLQFVADKKQRWENAMRQEQDQEQESAEDGEDRKRSKKTKAKGAAATDAANSKTPAVKRSRKA